MKTAIKLAIFLVLLSLLAEHFAPADIPMEMIVHVHV